MDQGLASNRDIINNNGMLALADACKYSKPEYSDITFLSISKYNQVIQKYGLQHVGIALSKIADAILQTKQHLWEKLDDIEYVFGRIVDTNLEIALKCGLFGFEELVYAVGNNVRYLFSSILPYTKHLIYNIEDLHEIGMLLVKDIENRNKTNLYISLIQNTSSKEEFLRRYEEIRLGERNKPYWTVQGLSSIGFLCCHVTNAYAGGLIPSNIKKDPFINIVNDVKHTFDYTPSISTIKPKNNSGLVVNDKNELSGSIGVIYDYGYPYESFLRDTCTKEIIDKKSGKRYRTAGLRDRKVNTLTAVNEANNEYNELLIRNWTVSGIFYTRGCIQSAIDRLKDISDELSYKKYIYGAYWYRTIKIGTPKHIIKVFPVYEIDLSNNTWKIVYIPNNKNYNIVVEKPNNTYRAIPYK